MNDGQIIEKRNFYQGYLLLGSDGMFYPHRSGWKLPCQYN